MVKGPLDNTAERLGITPQRLQRILQLDGVNVVQWPGMSYLKALGEAAIRYREALLTGDEAKMNAAENLLTWAANDYAETQSEGEY